MEGIPEAHSQVFEQPFFKRKRMVEGLTKL